MTARKTLGMKERINQDVKLLNATRGYYALEFLIGGVVKFE